MTNSNFIYSYLLNDSRIRAYFLTAPNLLTEINKTTTSDNQKPFLLAALNITALISSLAKGQQRLSLRLRPKKSSDKLSTDGFSTGQVTGYLTDHNAHLDFTNGTLQFIQTDTNGHSYTSFVGLETGDLYQDFATFFAVSEQTATLFLPLTTSPQNNVTCLLQLLPGNTLASLLETEKAILRQQVALDQLFKTAQPKKIPPLAEVLPSAHYLATKEISYACGCSQELFSQMLFSLSQQELATIIKNDETLTSQCSLCGARYTFPPDYLAFYLA